MGQTGWDSLIGSALSSAEPHSAMAADFRRDLVGTCHGFGLFVAEPPPTGSGSDGVFVGLIVDEPIEFGEGAPLGGSDQLNEVPIGAHRWLLPAGFHPHGSGSREAVLSVEKAEQAVNPVASPEVLPELGCTVARLK